MPCRRNDPGLSFNRPALALVEGRDSHAVPVTGRRAPSTPAILARVVEESAAAGVGTFLHAGKIATTEQGGSGFTDRNEHLIGLPEVRLESSFETPCSLDQSRGARWFPNHLVNGLKGPARNRPRVNNIARHFAQAIPQCQSLFKNVLSGRLASPSLSRARVRLLPPNSLAEASHVIKSS
jgi:hypothetical protein